MFHAYDSEALDCLQKAYNRAAKELCEGASSDERVEELIASTIIALSDGGETDWQRLAMKAASRVNELIHERQSS